MASSLLLAQNIVYITHLYIVSMFSIIIVAGLIGVTANIIIFTTVKQIRCYPSALYIVTESIADAGVLTFGTVTLLLAELYGYDSVEGSVLWCKIRTPTLQWFSSMVFSSVTFSAVDQWLSTSLDPRMRQFSTIKLAKYLISISSIFWIFYNIPFIVFYDVKVRFGCLLNNAGFTQYFSYFDLVVLRCLIPILITSVFSISAYRHVRHIHRQQLTNNRRRLDRQLTAMILARVTFSVFSSVPFFLQRFYVTNIQTSSNDILRSAIEHLVLAVCVTINYVNVAVS